MLEEPYAAVLYDMYSRQQQIFAENNLEEVDNEIPDHDGNSFQKQESAEYVSEGGDNMM